MANLFFVSHVNVLARFCRDAPAWVMSSPIDFSKSSILEPISSILVMIASDMSWNLDCYKAQKVRKRQAM